MTDTGRLENKMLGIIAGGGELPVLVAEGAKAHGARLAVLGLENHRSERLKELATSYGTVPIGNLGQCIRFFKESKVDTLVLCGQVDHIHIFNPADFDPLMKQVLAATDNRAEAILGRIAALFAEHGLTVTGVAPFIADHLSSTGHLAGPEPDERTAADIEFSFGLACRLAEINVGQSILVCRGTVLAVEAIEGTDGMIQRSAAFNVTGSTMAKVPLKNKDTRFDLPVIGSSTVEALSDIHASALVVAAEKTIFIDPSACHAAADRHGITLIARAMEDRE